jgi:hypothetical protein
MHKSQLCAFVIDCNSPDVDEAAKFWSAAMGKPIVPPTPDSGLYRGFKTAADELMLMVQKVDHPSRIHLDIETDDMEAEVKRLEGLGAKRVVFVKNWWVMEAPTGQRFCVVNPQRGPLGARANTWK